MLKLLRILPMVENLPRAGFFIALSSVMSSALNLAFPVVYLVIFDKILPTQDGDLINKTVMVAMTVSIFVVLSYFLMDQWAVSLRISATRSIRNAVVKKMLGLNYGFFQKKPTGDLIQRLIAEADTVGGVVSLVFKSVGSIFEVSVMLILLLCLNRISLGAYVLFAVAYVVWTCLLKKSIIRQRSAMASETGKTYDRFFEMLLGVKQIKSLNLEKRQVAMVKKDLEAMRRKSADGAILESALIHGPRFFAKMTFLVGLIFSFLRLRAGDISIGTFVMSILLMNRIPRPFDQLSGLASALHSGTSASRRLRQLLSEKPEKSGTVRFSGIETGIELKDIYFSLLPGKPILEGLSLSIFRGQTVAIVGESGSGKSSLVNLLLRLHDAGQGSIKIDGIEISDYEVKSLRSKIIMVSQDVFLFNDSIRRNIDLECRLTDSQLSDICGMCQLSGLIAKSALGLDTAVGERGAMLSGGERQRIAIARAIAKDADVLILDEATSALDPAVERSLREMIESYRLRKPRLTVIVISHRIDAVKDAEVIHLIHKGRIVEYGTHAELFAKRSHYWNLFENRRGLPKPAEASQSKV